MSEPVRHYLPTCISVSHLSALFHNVSMFTKEVNPDAHEYHELFYVNECTKEHKLIIGNKTHLLKAGQLMICPPGVTHLNASKNHSVITIIGFDTDSDIS